MAFEFLGAPEEEALEYADGLDESSVIEIPSGFFISRKKEIPGYMYLKTIQDESGKELHIFRRQ